MPSGSTPQPQSPKVRPRSRGFHFFNSMMRMWEMSNLGLRSQQNQYRHTRHGDATL